MIPFSTDVFLGVVAQHNAALWPLQLVSVFCALGVIYLSLRPNFRIERLPALYLAAAWLLLGAVYYGVHFTHLNWAAWLAAGLFAVQGLLFFWFGVIRNRLRLRFKSDAPSWLGIALIAAATLGYPPLGLATGTGAAAIPIVATDPGPTVLFTWGYLLLTAEKTMRPMLPIPFVAAWVGAAAGWLLALPADIVLAPAALAGLIVILTVKRCSARRA